MNPDLSCQPALHVLFFAPGPGDDYWESLWTAATKAADDASSAVALTISDRDNIDCGIAWVQLPDARAGFARWARRADKDGYPSRPGFRIEAHTPEQAVEVRHAYAEAFARVLLDAGIPCKVESWATEPPPKEVEPGQEDPAHCSDPQFAFFLPRITLLRRELDEWFDRNGLGIDFGWYLPNTEDFERLEINWFDSADLVLIFDGTGLCDILSYHTPRHLEDELGYSNESAWRAILQA